MPSGPDDGFLEGLYQTMRKHAENLAPHFRPGYGATELDGDDLETVWNRRALTLEQEWALHREMAEDGITPKYSREQIGLMVFPDREKLVKSGGRVEPAEWVKWANQTAKRMAAKRAAREAAMNAVPSAEGGMSDGMV